MTRVPENNISEHLPSAAPSDAFGGDTAEEGATPPLWGFRDGAVLCLCANPHAIPDWAAVRYTFARPSELVFAAHYVPLVRTLSGDTVEGDAFTSHDAAREFRALRRDRP
jgi:hypothetical protein